MEIPYEVIRYVILPFLDLETRVHCNKVLPAEYRLIKKLPKEDQLENKQRIIRSTLSNFVRAANDSTLYSGDRVAIIIGFMTFIKGSDAFAFIKSHQRLLLMTSSRCTTMLTEQSHQWFSSTKERRILKELLKENAKLYA